MSQIENVNTNTGANGKLSYATFLQKSGKEPISKMTEVQDLYICIDAGSTETRSMLFVTEDLMDENYSEPEVFVMDTATTKLYDPIEGLRTSNTIADNLEMEIITPEESHRIARGSIRKYLTKSSVTMSSAISKIDQLLTRYSVWSQCALTALYHAMETDTLAGTYNVHLTLSLPPEDTKTIRMEKIKQSLSGLITVNFTRFGKRINLNIIEEYIEIYAEPVAAAHYYVYTHSHDDESYDTDTDIGNETVVFLDCGGRSKGAVLAVNGEQILNGTVTAMGGGEAFMLDVAKRVSNKFNINAPTVDTIISSLNDGYIRIGTETKDIVPEINNSKIVLAEDCAALINKLLDAVHVQIESVQRIVCTGRTFMPIVRDRAVVSKSLAEYIERQFSNIPVHIIFERYSDSNPIVRGLYLYTIDNVISEIYPEIAKEDF